jgi:hypothetical protein
VPPPLPGFAPPPGCDGVSGTGSKPITPPLVLLKAGAEIPSATLLVWRIVPPLRLSILLAALANSTRAPSSVPPVPLNELPSASCVATFRLPPLLMRPLLARFDAAMFASAVA